MLDEADALLKTEKDLSPAIKTMMTMLLLVIRLLLNRLGINSENSSTPPSQDLNRAEFPKHVTSKVQYGLQVKAHAVYMSQYQ